MDFIFSKALNLWPIYDQIKMKETWVPIEWRIKYVDTYIYIYTHISLPIPLFFFPWVSSQNVRHCPSLGLESQEGRIIWRKIYGQSSWTLKHEHEFESVFPVYVSIICVFLRLCGKLSNFFRGVENLSPEMCLESCTNSHTTGSVFDPCWGILFNRMTANKLLPTTGATSATKALDRLSIVRQQEVLTQSLGPVTSYKWGYNSIYMGL